MFKRVMFYGAAASAMCLVLSACGGTQLNMTEMQTTTAKTLGLASSDEITVTNVQYVKKNAIGGSKISYDATTARGRKFTCTAFVIPGLTPLDKATYTDGECHPRA
ncbi:hypothetical protein [Caballeronia sp. LZ035]|uniref:hypothetical protein n=1 Tax=Caballeronia sp. LZ035 TaxID=3038568 RepID=UPI002856E9B4|nr:hypothetical protein [Caballeronia sp. LZ035]MDR5759321.1 hypothetical protein [Caballeronia sp. LZ035]